MKNNEVLERFLNGYRNAYNHSHNLYIQGDKLFNYSTCIAKREKGQILVSNRYYSATTSRHQNYLKRNAPNTKEVFHDELNPR